MPYGLPQRSVLGPLLYIIYTSEIGSLLTASAVLGHLYADDVQAYLHCLATNTTSAVRTMSQALGFPGSLDVNEPPAPQPIKNPIYLDGHSAAACEARPIHHCC